MTYRTQSIDTSIEAEQFQLQLLKEAGPLRRFKQVRSLTATTRQMSWSTLRRLRPHLSAFEAALAFVELVYGKPLATQLRSYHLARQGFPLVCARQARPPTCPARRSEADFKLASNSTGGK
jgi:hypothetical protein